MIKYQPTKIGETQHRTIQFIQIIQGATFNTRNENHRKVKTFSRFKGQRTALSNKGRSATLTRYSRNDPTTPYTHTKQFANGDNKTVIDGYETFDDLDQNIASPQLGSPTVRDWPGLSRDWNRCPVFRVDAKLSRKFGGNNLIG